MFEFFADDVVFEYPYAPSLGMPDRLEGKATVVSHIRSLLAQLTGLTVRNIHSYSVAGDPDTVFSEYEGEALTRNGGTYQQIYMSKMLFRDGQLVLLRELWNPMKVIEAAGGTATV
ncbi:nuclear transport factor 2 family protein [Streptomyces sp. NPDC088354]|uniref:nuclear transport factor 2 family protein n=1 Tax=Streptomyces sp. NPDC088354 TaxID=3365856 RepID=UPI0038266B5D